MYNKHMRLVAYVFAILFIFSIVGGAQADSFTYGMDSLPAGYFNPTYGTGTSTFINEGGDWMLQLTISKGNPNDYHLGEMSWGQTFVDCGVETPFMPAAGETTTFSTIGQFSANMGPGEGHGVGSAGMGLWNRCPPSQTGIMFAIRPLSPFNLGGGVQTTTYFMVVEYQQIIFAQPVVVDLSTWNTYHVEHHDNGDGTSTARGYINGVEVASYTFTTFTEFLSPTFWHDNLDFHGRSPKPQEFQPNPEGQWAKFTEFSVSY